MTLDYAVSRFEELPNRESAADLLGVVLTYWQAGMIEEGTAVAYFAKVRDWLRP